MSSWNWKGMHGSQESGQALVSDSEILKLKKKKLRLMVAAAVMLNKYQTKLCVCDLLLPPIWRHRDSQLQLLTEWSYSIYHQISFNHNSEYYRVDCRDWNEMILLPLLLLLLLSTCVSSWHLWQKTNRHIMSEKCEWTLKRCILEILPE